MFVFYAFYLSAQTCTLIRSQLWTALCTSPTYDNGNWIETRLRGARANVDYADKSKECIGTERARCQVREKLAASRLMAKASLQKFPFNEDEEEDEMRVTIEAPIAVIHDASLPWSEDSMQITLWWEANTESALGQTRWVIDPFSCLIKLWCAPILWPTGNEGEVWAHRKWEMYPLANHANVAKQKIRSGHQDTHWYTFGQAASASFTHVHARK